MNTSKISGVVPAALWAQLSNQTSGVNPRLVALADSQAYKFDAFEIDWSDTSTNFIFGRIDPGLLQESSVFTFPMVTIDIGELADRGTDPRRIKTATFSGLVIGLVEVHHTWESEGVLADFGALVNATGDAILNCLNDHEVQQWPGNLLWNGRARMVPGPLKMGGQGWLRTTQFLCPFELAV